MLLSTLACVDASAHAFVQQYTLPVPFSLYAGGASLALILSFIAAAVLARTPNTRLSSAHIQSEFGQKIPSSLINTCASGISTLILIVCIVSGIIGTREPFQNINMTVFWIVLFLGIPYAVVLFGDFFAAINPWIGLVSGIERIIGKSFEGRIRYPRQLGHFPGLTLYMLLIVLELFGQLRPLGLSIALGIYSVIMVAGAWLFGRDAWLTRAEVFGIQCRLLGMISANTYFKARRAQRPMMATLEQHPIDLGLVLFVLFMLSSTAFDGLHATVPWANSYWEFIYPHITWVDAVWSTAAHNGYAASTALYRAWQWAALLASPFIYFGIFALFLRFSGITGRSTLSTRELLARFTFCLLPIAFVYHVSHYFLLLLMQGPQIIRLASDPFGFGWNLLGTAQWKIEPITLDIEIVWHTQVALIILGHMASVLIAHYQSLRTFGTPRHATLSQLPMLGLMVLFTASGLWILSLPISPTS